MRIRSRKNRVHSCTHTHCVPVLIEIKQSTIVRSLHRDCEKLIEPIKMCCWVIGRTYFNHTTIKRGQSEQKCVIWEVSRLHTSYRKCTKHNEHRVVRCARSREIRVGNFYPSNMRNIHVHNTHTRAPATGEHRTHTQAHEELCASARWFICINCVQCNFYVCSRDSRARSSRRVACTHMSDLRGTRISQAFAHIRSLV